MFARRYCGAVSRLSRPRLMTRGGGAGPAVATPEANCLGLNEVSYGWAPLSQLGLDEQLVEAYRLAELFSGCTLAVPFVGNALPHSDWLLNCDNNAVRVMALYVDDSDDRNSSQSEENTADRDGKGDTSQTIVRLLNVTPHQLKVRVEVNLALECFAGAAPIVQLINLDGAVLSTVQCECAQLGTAVPNKAGMSTVDRNQSAVPNEQAVARSSADTRVCHFELNFGAHQLVSLALRAAAPAQLT